MEKQKKSPEPFKKTEGNKSKVCELTQDAVSQQENQYLTRCTRFRLSTEYELSICNCKHILRMTIGERHSVVNPQKWSCNVCFTTESVWACLSCPNVACGRYIKEHALNHYTDTKHPLVIDVNELYVYCYECEEYVLNDNKSGDIKVLRETLQAIRYQNFTGTTRSGHTLRTAAISADEDVQMRRRLQQQQLDRDDRTFTAIWHSRFVRQRKTFRHWLHYVRRKKERPDLKDDSDDEEEHINELAEKSATESQALSTFQTKESAELQQPPIKDIVISPNLSTEASFLGNNLPNLNDNSSTCKHDTISTTVSPAAEKQTLSVPEVPTETKRAPHYPEHSDKVVVSAPCNEDTNVAFSISRQLNVETFEEQTLPVFSENEVFEDAAKTQDVAVPQAAEDTDNHSPKPDVIVILADDATSDTNNTSNDSRESVNTYAVECKLTESVSKSISPPEVAAQAKDGITSRSSTTTAHVSSFLTEEPRRPKRANAASRYKEIMYQLSPLATSEPLHKRLRLRKPENQADEFHHDKGIVPYRRRSVRLSLRLLKANKEKAAKEAKQRKRMKRKISKQPQRINRNRKKPERKLPSRTLPHRRSRMQSLSKSLYDSIPNRAVTSLIPGVTGLRNLGNTCYLNSIIQVLGHLQKFRRCLLAVQDLEMNEKLITSDEKATPKLSLLARRSTIEMYENQTSQSVTRRFLRMQAGLNGGRESRSPDKSKDFDMPLSPRPRIYSGSSSPNTLSLCHELHDLYHIMWSGKWKMVSPYQFLSSVWQLIPSFRGYSQQDAQEFLCELLDKIVSELERRRRSQANKAEILAARISRVVHAVFEGQLHSQVRCLECRNISSTYEPFWDLSLEFPQRYHCATSSSWKNPNQGCSLMEMLDKFTEAERLDGGRVYNCSRCNGLYLPQTKGQGTRRRSLSSGRKNSEKLSEAEKQIKITQLPQILRFHLKRFRWSGRNNREKIIVHVDFPPELDMRPHCWLDGEHAEEDSRFIYDLSAVVIHHGRGFSSGHYTAYCWNDIGKFWVHCNDSNLELCSIDDVMAAQAYILFYSQRGLDPHPHLFTPPATPDLSPSVTPNVFSNPEENMADKCLNDSGKG